MKNHCYAQIKVITLFRLLAPHRVGIDVFVTKGFGGTGTATAAAACCRKQPMPRRLLYHLSWRSSTYVIFGKSKRIFQHRKAQRVVCFTSSPPLFTLLRLQNKILFCLFVYSFLWNFFFRSFRCYYCKIEFLLIFSSFVEIFFLPLLKFYMSHYTNIGYIDCALSHSIGWFNWCFYSLVKCSHSWSCLKHKKNDAQQSNQQFFRFIGCCCLRLRRLHILIQFFFWFTLGWFLFDFQHKPQIVTAIWLEQMLLYIDILWRLSLDLLVYFSNDNRKQNKT